jgi:hypothetical protein
VEVYFSDILQDTPETMNTVLRTLDFVKESPRYIIGNKVLVYSFSVCREEPNTTFWVLGFFDAKPFWVFTPPPEKPVV